MVEKASTLQKAGPPGLRLSSPGERKRNADSHKCGEVNMLQFCSVSNSLSNTTLSNKVRGTYFSKELCRSSLLCFVMILHAYVDVDVLFVCIDDHGSDYTTHRGVGEGTNLFSLYLNPTI